jgi:hypothetical protein
MGLLYVGIGLIAAGIIVLIIHIGYIKTAESVIGEIAGVYHGGYGFGVKRAKSTTVSYVVDGVEYRKAFSEYWTFSRRGTKKKIYYRKNNPERAITASGNLFVVFILLALGIAFIVMTIYFPENIGTS